MDSSNIERKIVFHLIFKKISLWAVFSVAFALLPIFFNFLKLIVRSVTPTYEILLSHGELLIVSVAISSAALGELVASDISNIKKIYISGTAILIIACSSYWFADISSAYYTGQYLDINIIAKGSLIMFGLTLIASLSCIVMSEASKWLKT